MIFYEKFASLIMQRYKILTIFIGINNILILQMNF